MGAQIDRNSFYVALAVFVLSWALFYYQTHFLLNSLFAALIAAACVWATYVLLRWLYLALK